MPRQYPRCATISDQQSLLPTVGRATVRAVASNHAVTPSQAVATSRVVPSNRAATAEFEAWMARYAPVERAIIEARERRLARKAARLSEKARAFGALCEATGGQAKTWRAQGLSCDEQVRLADGDVWTLQCLARYYGRSATRALDGMRHRLKRPFYYEAENARRRALAVERRRIRKRTTENPCPTREQILEAWIHLKDSHEATIRFGSLIEDLACYVDSSLRLDEQGAICGRRGGVKAWLQENIPALALRYKTVMRYKALARKLRQIAGIADPMPANRIVGAAAAREVPRPVTDGNEIMLRTKSFVAEYGRADKLLHADGREDREDEIGQGDELSLEIVRARAIWKEVIAGIRPNPTALAARIDALMDPERVEEATMLAEWRERYAREITERTKMHWWKRLCAGAGVVRKEIFR